MRSIGLSEAPPAWLRAACAIHPIECVQQEWSLYTRNLEETLVPTCVELGVGIVAYSPLARNLLTMSGSEAAPTDWRAATIPRYDADNYRRNQDLAARVTAIAASKGVSGAQLSLAWLCQKAQIMGVSSFVAIPGSTNVAHALDNLGALGCPALSDEEMAQLEALGEMVAGERGDADYLERGIEGRSLLGGGVSVLPSDW